MLTILRKIGPFKKTSSISGILAAPFRVRAPSEEEHAPSATSRQWWRFSKVRLTKKLLKPISVLSISILLASCATAPKSPVFRELPEISVEQDEAWKILLETIRNYDFAIETANKERWNVSSAWLVTKECWRGILYEGMGPCEKERFVAISETLRPLKVRIAVEKQKRDMLYVKGQWIPYWKEIGNNVEKEEEIYEDLVRKLTRPSQ